ncbi:decaprenyl-phosphate phosphoribosyltransferase [Halocola ammonii]
MGELIKLMRPRQWIKNVFVFLPAFFGGAINTLNLFDLAIGFVAFSLAASSIYIFNDWRDLQFDKLHPIKKQRPLASGKVSIPLALAAGFSMLVAAIVGIVVYLNSQFVWILAIYVVLNVLYSLGLKKVSILDLLIVSSGFVLRVAAGAELVQVELSFWLLLMTFLFSMFIVVGKRRDDFRDGVENARSLRPVNEHYNQFYLDSSIVLLSALMIVCYIMYTYFSPYFQGKIYLALLSSALVMIGLLRYLQALFVENRGGAPTDLAFRDRFIQIVVLLWLSVFAFIIYFK